MATKTRKDEGDKQAGDAPVNLGAVDMTGAATYRKVGPIKAVQLDPNGGDWVAEDEKGQRWLITNQVFLENYARQ